MGVGSISMVDEKNNNKEINVTKLQVEYAHMSIPLFSDREYVVLNGFVNEEESNNNTATSTSKSSSTFYSCSVTAATTEKKGSSIYDIPTPTKPQKQSRGIYVRMAYFLQHFVSWQMKRILLLIVVSYITFR